MPQRRQIGIAFLTTVVTAALVAAPFHISMKGWTPTLGAQVASAKDGKGGGNGGKGGGKNGGGQSNGGGKGNPGGKGAGGGKGGGGRAGPGKSSAGKSASQARKNAAAGERYNPRTGDSVVIDGAGIEVVHRNGMREKVSDGSYEMKDNKGRTIIVRPATGADVSRLRDMRS